MITIENKEVRYTRTERKTYTFQFKTMNILSKAIYHRPFEMISQPEKMKIIKMVMGK